MSDATESARLLGEIKGIVSQMAVTQKTHTEKFESLDGRLRSQEGVAARHGAFAGTAMAVGVALIIEGIKTKLGLREPG